MRRIKIAFFITTTARGGAETFLLRFLTEMKERVEAVIFCKAGFEGELSDEFRNIGFEVKKMKMGFIPCKGFVCCYQNLRQLNPDVVCDFTGDFGGIVMLCAKLAGVKSRIIEYRGSTHHFKPTFFRLQYWKFAHRLTEKYATRFISNSEAAFDFLFTDRNRLSQPFNVVYNGVVPPLPSELAMRNNIRAKYDIPDDAFVVGHVGNFRPQKNHAVLMEVAIKLCQLDKSFYFLCCGKGVDVAYADMLKEKGLSSRIICTGSVSKTYEYLSAMDAFCFPSLTEGQSNALIEAMLTNLPFVASNIPANRETVPSNLHSELVAPLDVVVYCEKILKIKAQNDYRNNLKCTQWALERYDSQKRFEEMLNALTDDVLKNPH